MPKSRKVGVGGKSIGSITLSFNKKFQVADIEIKGKGDLIPMSAIRDAMTLINNAVLQARGSRKRSRVEQRKEERIKENEKLKAKAQKELDKIKADKLKAAEELIAEDKKAEVVKVPKEVKLPEVVDAKPDLKIVTPVVEKKQESVILTPSKGEK